MISISLMDAERITPMLRCDMNEASNCGARDCKGAHVLQIAPDCHPRSAMRAAFDPEIGCVNLTCSSCGDLAIRFLVHEELV